MRSTTILPRQAQNVGRFSLGAAAVVAASAMAIPTAIAYPGEQTRPHQESYVEQTLALGGDGVFPNYRIPALAYLGDGRVLASYDGRPSGKDAPGPNSILQRVSNDGGRTWGSQTVLRAGNVEENLGYSDPSYVVDRDTGWIFNFHVFSKDTGVWNSTFGNDDADRQVMSAEVSVSKDNGVTWEHRSVTKTVKPANVRATFASSGEGIQLRYGRHKGRLIQQYAGWFKKGDKEVVKAYSLYSDNHGKTWKRGKPVGVDMDENKVVELSDGSVLLNSRDHVKGGYRKTAISRNGGESYRYLGTDRELIDPANNAQITRMFPDARAHSTDAQKLLFSNAASKTERENGTVRYSCDDGRNWSTSRVFQPGDTSYSVVTSLGQSGFGLFYEGASNEQKFARFNASWLAGGNEYKLCESKPNRTPARAGVVRPDGDERGTLELGVSFGEYKRGSRISLTGLERNEWVYVFVGGNTDQGWVRTNNRGIAKVTIPSDARTGRVAVAVYNDDVRFEGWSAISVTD